MTTIAQPSSSSPAGGDDSRDLQREALRSLVELSNESAVSETQIEQRRAAALAEAKKRHDKASAELAQQRDNAHEQVRQRYDEEVARIDAEASQQLDDLNEQDETFRSRIADDVETADVETKQQYQQASWLAESVFEGTINQVQKEAKAEAELLEQRQTAIETIEMQANHLVATYGHSVPPDDGSTAPPPAVEEATSTSRLLRTRFSFQAVSQVRTKARSSSTMLTRPERPIPQRPAP